MQHSSNVHFEKMDGWTLAIYWGNVTGRLDHFALLLKDHFEKMDEYDWLIVCLLLGLVYMYLFADKVNARKERHHIVPDDDILIEQYIPCPDKSDVKEVEKDEQYYHEGYSKLDYER